MGKLSETAKSKFRESLHNHPGRWAIAGMITAAVVAGASYDAQAGHFDRTPQATADANPPEAVADSKNTTHHKKQAANNANALGQLSCVTHVESNGVDPTIRVTFSHGRMPDNASIAAVVHFAGDKHGYHYGGDQGSTIMDVPTRHGHTVAEATAIITAGHPEQACTPWPGATPATGA